MTNAINTAAEWTVEEFLRFFDDTHTLDKERRFCWIIGAGASRESGIPTGGELAKEWLEQLHGDARVGGQSLEQWATASNLGINDFDYLRYAEFYPQIFERRFRLNRRAGYAALEKAMEGKDPSPGYSVLAKILEHRHRIVITTNFDNLIADALAIFTRSLPLVCGHESLTAYVRASITRPLICKIHRDLLLTPHNDPKTTSALSDGWELALRGLLSGYTPIVIGYGGNDGSLMGLLEKLGPDQICSPMVWCYHYGSPTPDRVRKLVAKHHGTLVAIRGFDALMVELGAKLGFGSLEKEIITRATQRVKAYTDAMQSIVRPAKHSAQKPQPETVKAIEAMAERTGGWLAWDLRAQQEMDPAKKEEIYRAGIREIPNSVELLNHLARFLASIKKNDEALALLRKARQLDPGHSITMNNLAFFLTELYGAHDEAEALYRKALEIEPEDVNLLSNLAHLLSNVRKRYDEAEALYRKILYVDPKEVDTLVALANLLTSVRGQHDQAEALYRNALEIDPRDVPTLVNFALLLTKVRRQHDQAEALYRKALEIDPRHVVALNNLAFLLTDVRGQHDEAEALYRKALEIEPGDVTALSNLAYLLSNIRNRYDEAEALYRKILEVDPKEAGTLYALADLLTNARGRHDEAEALYRKALEIDPDAVCILVDYANLLTKVRGQHDRAEALYRKALEIDPRHVITLNNLAFLLTDVRGLHDEAEALYRKALEIDPNHIGALSNLAALVTNVRGQHDKAEAAYRKILEVDPKDVDTLASLASIFLARRKVVDAWPFIHEALRLSRHAPTQATSAALIYAVIAAALENKTTEALPRLKWLFAVGYARDRWNCDRLLASLDGKVSTEDRRFFTALAAAVLDGGKVADLDAFPPWQALQPIALQAPWDLLDGPGPDAKPGV